MLSPFLFNLVSELLCGARGQISSAFGEVQILVCGDFYQLPPPTSKKGAEHGCQFVFQTQAWKNCNFKAIELVDVHRQAGQDHAQLPFVHVLNEIRLGKLTDGAKAILRGRMNLICASGGVVPTKIYCTNDAANEANSSSLRALPGTTYSYVAIDAIVSRDSRVVRNSLTQVESGVTPLIANTLPDKSQFKVGAQVSLKETHCSSVTLTLTLTGIWRRIYIFFFKIERGHCRRNNRTSAAHGEEHCSQ